MQLFHATSALVSSGLPPVTFDGGGITGQVTGSMQINYAVPGNSYPSNATALSLTVTVPKAAVPGLYGVSVNGGPAMPAVIRVAV